MKLFCKTLVLSFLGLVLIGFYSLPMAPASAHQPREVQANQEVITIENPEVSQAFYGQLKGGLQTFELKSDKNFLLYVNVLVPKLPNIEKNISADIYAENNRLIHVLDSTDFNWTVFREPFGGESFKGPEYSQDQPAGTYQIKVYSPTNEDQYVLAVGSKEEFSFQGIVQTLKVLPGLKKNFFHKSPLTIIFSLTGLFLFVALLVFIGLIFLIIKIIRSSRKINRPFLKH